MKNQLPEELVKLGASAPCLLPNVFEGTYRKAPGVNNSLLSHFEKSALHARYSLENPSEPTDAMIRGRRVHELILEPELFKERYIYMPDLTHLAVKADGSAASNPKNTKAYKEAVQNFREQNANKVCLDREEWALLHNIKEAVYSHPDAMAFIEGAKFLEGTAFAYDERTELLLKGRLDIVNTDLGCVADLKMTSDARPRFFGRKIDDFNLHRQGAMYRRLARACGFDVEYHVFIVVEDSAPHGVAVYRLDDEALELGDRELESLLDRYKEAVTTDIWPGYSDEIQDISLPEYRLKIARSNNR
jgi:hypothetical protein